MGLNRTQPISHGVCNFNNAERTKFEQERNNIDKIDLQKIDTDSFIDRIGEMSNPPSVRKCYQQRYMNPRASLPNKEIGLSSNCIELTRHQRMAKGGHSLKNKYIPCMYLRSGYLSSKLLIYFHGNGEDINTAFDLLSHLRSHLRVNKFLSLT